MGKINLKGLACLGRYQRFEDSSSIGSGVDISDNNISYNCSHCGHHGTVNAEEYRRSDKKTSSQTLLNNSSSNSSLLSEKFILGKNSNSSVKSVVNDLGLSKKNSDKNSTLVKKWLSFKKEDNNDLLSESFVKKISEDWSQNLDESDDWYRPGFDRDLTNQHLSSLSTGSFIVRRSKSRRDALALSIKTPNRHHLSSNKIAHYLILVLPNGAGFCIKGSKKTFTSLRSLIIHHSVMSEILPCPLLLPSNRFRHVVDGCGSENASESSETDEEEEDSRDEDIADISNYPDLLLTLRQTLYATQDLSN